MKIGNWFAKLATEYAATQAITFLNRDGDKADNATVTLNDGYASDGKTMMVVNTAHEARLFVQAARKAGEAAKPARVIAEVVLENPSNVIQMDAARVQAMAGKLLMANTGGAAVVNVTPHDAAMLVLARVLAKAA